MKKTKTLYWIFTGLFAALMLFSAIPDILVLPDTVTFMANLGYPKYLVPFLGIAKLVGAAAILIPGFPRVKEWAYAGLFIDLIGATYSQVSLAGFIAPEAFMLLPIALGTLSYVYYHRKLANGSAAEKNVALSFQAA